MTVRPRPDNPSVLIGSVAWGYSAAAVLAGPGIVLAIWLAHRRRPRPRRCDACGYDLTGNESGVCPECGKAI